MNIDIYETDLKKIQRKINQITKKCHITKEDKQKYSNILKQSIPKARSRKKWPHFSYQNLKCQCGCEKMEMNRDFMENLEYLRNAFNRPLVIISGYRCLRYDTKISKPKEKKIHTTGCAVDIKISGKDAYDLLFLAMGVDFTGIGIKQKGAMDKRYIHLDNLSKEDYPRPQIWSY